jgi:hypothetical protein
MVDKIRSFQVNANTVPPIGGAIDPAQKTICDIAGIATLNPADFRDCRLSDLCGVSLYMIIQR